MLIRNFNGKKPPPPPNNAHYTRPWPRSKGVLKTIGLSHCSHTTWSAHLYNSFFMLFGSILKERVVNTQAHSSFSWCWHRKEHLKRDEMQLNFEKLHSKPKHLTEQVGNCKNRIIFRILLFHIERGESRIYKFRKNEMLTSVARPRITIPVFSLFVIFFLITMCIGTLEGANQEFWGFGEILSVLRL